MIELWHGGTRWEGPPEVRGPKQGKYECGPGIYLTTRYLRARDYARGSKVTTLVTLADDIRWLEKTKLPLKELIEYAKTAPRLPKRARDNVVAYLLRDPEGNERELDSLQDVTRLVNLLINEEALAGQPGVHLAEWLTSKGIDASLHTPMSQEQWVIVFNPKVIRKHRVVPASQVDLSQYELPTIELPKGAIIKETTQ